ncbi:hypothetical protein Hanom_Chr10g00935601 [Helianthus anomalus]
MAIKVKPQGPRFKKFEIWTKMAKVPKPQGPKWQFTHYNFTCILRVSFFFLPFNESSSHFFAFNGLNFFVS